MIFEGWCLFFADGTLTIMQIAALWGLMMLVMFLPALVYLLVHEHRHKDDKDESHTRNT
jgi:hypothetical protein